LRNVVLCIAAVFVICSGSVGAAGGLFTLSMTTDFDKSALEDYAAEEGWEEVWNAVFELGERSVQPEHDWLLVSAMIETPLIRWVKIYREAYIQEYDQDATALLYQGQIADYPTDEVLEFNVNIFSLEPERLETDNVCFVLKDDQGQSWDEPNVTAEGISEQIYSFGIAYDEFFNVVFDFNGREPDWSVIEELTLSVTYTEETEAHTLSWDLEPLP